MSPSSPASPPALSSAPPDDERRYQALLALPIAGEAGLAALLAALRDSSWRVRRAAVDRLVSELPATLAVPKLIPALSDQDDPSLRSAAIEALIRFGEGAVPALCEALVSGPGDARKFAADALGETGSPRALGALKAALSDADENVRGAAVEALGKLGGAAASEELLRVAASGRVELQLPALEALAGGRSSVPFELLEAHLADRQLRRAAVRALGRSSGVRAQAAILAATLDRARGAREAAFAALAAFRRSGGDGRDGGWEGVVAALAPAQRDALSAAAVATLGAEERGAARGAAQLLGWLGAPEAAAPLVRAAEREELRPVLKQALLDLGPGTLPALGRDFPALPASGRALALEAVAAMVRLDAAASFRGAAQALALAGRADDEEDVRLAAGELLRLLDRAGAGESPASLSAEEFRLLRDLVYEHCGILFRKEMSYLVERRLRPRLRALSLSTFESYHRYLRQHPERERELDAAVEALATNETYFFREPNQLRAFAEEILPELAARNAAGRRLRIWSAGCSTGEECYTISILVLRSGRFRGWEVEILGSDISRRVLAAARQAEYGASALRATSEELRREHFEPHGGRFTPRAEVRAPVSFAQANLLDGRPVAAGPPVDVVFCRNVMIYFDQPARRRVLRLLYDRLVPGGYLLLGHSESLINTTADFELVHLRHDVAYRKPAAAEAGNGTR